MVFILDENLFKKERYSYSLKRLVFIFEVLRQMDVLIYKGTTEQVLEHLMPDVLWIPGPVEPTLVRILEDFSRKNPRSTLKWVEDTPFSDVPKNILFTRFLNIGRIYLGTK